MYIYSSADIHCVITGTIGSTTTQRTLYNYPIAAGVTRPVYSSSLVTYITEIAVYGVATSAIIKIYINGTDIAHQVYQRTVGADYTLVVSSGVYRSNTFVAPPPGYTAETTDFSKSISITAPTASENITLFFTEEEVTIQDINDVIRGAGASVSWNIAFGPNRTVASTTVFLVDRITSSPTGSSTSSFDNALIPANSWLWLTTSATAGTIEDINITIKYI